MENRADGLAPSEAAGYRRRDPQLPAVLSSLSPTAAVSSVRDTRAAPVPIPSTSFEHESAGMMEVDRNSGVEDRTQRATSVLSMDDIEAAQALEGLRADYGQSPRPSRSSQQVSPPMPPTSNTPQPEPLLSLLTSTHPLVSSAIRGSMSAYTSSKSYSRPFKYGAEFIERNIGSPVATTVGSVGRKTGVEGGIRWALQRRESAGTDADRRKRRKVSGEDHPDQMDIEKGLRDSVLPTRSRRSSDLSFAESLPPYDDHRSPGYEELSGDNEMISKEGGTAMQTRQTWQNRLAISTSGLGVAMSEESLRSLQYCLTWLKWANGRLGQAIIALKDVLKGWDGSEQQSTDNSAAAGTESSADRAVLSQRIQAVKEDVLATLKQVVDIVSKYTGGALPENARNLVRRHLTSLPQRFRIASTSNPPPGSSAASSDAATNAHRIFVLAQEGLDMMAQVSGVVNDTLVSAETWCERLGRKRPATTNASGEQTPRSGESQHVDVKTPIYRETGQQDIEMTETENKA